MKHHLELLAEAYEEMNATPDFLKLENILLKVAPQLGDESYVQNIKDTARLISISKERGYGSDWKKSTPEDFFYLVRLSYFDQDANAQNGMAIGVSQDGQNVALFSN